jgi:uncharacterized phage protein (TIGR02220 family)
MLADDDGYVEYVPVMRTLNLGQPAVNQLATSGYLEVYEEGVAKIVHWLKNNQIRKDRYTESDYKKQKLQPLIVGGKPLGNQTATKRQPSVVKGSVVKGSKLPHVEQSDNIPYKKIIDHLNKVSGKTYKHTSRANQKLIAARWNEGYRLKEFIQVIDNYDKKTKGTEYHQYLRPSTLFNGKFDDRLNWKLQQEDERPRGRVIT